jgi:hypothetical protein
MVKSKQPRPIVVPSKPGSSPSFTLIAEPRKKPDVQLFADALLAHVLDQMEREKNGGKLKGKPRSSRIPFTLLPSPKRKADPGAS